jgi:hypothetical protein
MRVMRGPETANRQPKLKPLGTIRSGDVGRPLGDPNELRLARTVRAGPIPTAYALNSSDVVGLWPRTTVKSDMQVIYNELKR